MVNRYYNRRPIEGQLYSPNLEMISQALEQTQKQYDTNFGMAQTIRNRFVESLEQDRKVADQLQDETAKKVDSIVQAYNGDYSRASKDLTKLLGDIEKEYQPGGKAHAISYNLKTFRDVQAENNDRLKKGAITAKQIEAQYNWFHSNYKGIGEKNADTGSYNIARIDPLADYADSSKLADEATAKIKPRKRSVTRSVREGNNWREVTEEIDAVDPNEVALAIQGALSDGKYMSYATQLAAYQGIDPEEAVNADMMQQMQTYLPQRSGVFGRVDKNLFKGMDDEAKLRMQQAHDYRMENLKQANRKAMADYTKKLDTEGDSYDSVGLLALNKNATKSFDTLELGENGRVSVGIIPGMTKTYNIDELLQSSEPIPGLNVNKSLLQTIRRENPRLSSQEVAAKYNASLGKTNALGTGIYYGKYNHPDQAQQAADIAVMQASSDLSRVFKVNSDGTVTQVQSSVLEDKYDREKRTSKMVGLGRTKGFSGNVPKGTVVADGSDIYIIEDNDERMRLYNGTKDKKGDKEKAFGFIYNGASQSDLFEMEAQGKRINSVGVASYVKDEEGDYVPDYKYYSGRYDPFIRMVVPNYNDPWVTEDGRPFSPSDVEANMLGSLEANLKARQKISASKEVPQQYQ